MAIKVVEFQDKINLNTNPQIPEINKVVDSNMNDLKDVANTNANNIGDLESLKATNKETLVNAINSSLNPVFLGEASGTNSVELPDEFNELFVIVTVNNNAQLSYLFNIPKAILSSESIGINQGYAATSINVAGHCRISASLSEISLLSAVSNGANVTSNSSISVYYK